MFKLACLAALVASAAAFAPSGRMPRRSAMTMRAADKLIGADVETDGIWDPLNLSRFEDRLDRYRAVELKHGRVAMLAVLGNLVTDAGFKPLYDGKIPSGLAAIGKVPTAGWVQILFAIGVFELTFGQQDPKKAPGDISNFGNAFIPDDAAEFDKLKLRELKNGRLAMIAILGEFAQEIVTGQSTLQQLAEGHLTPFGDGQGVF